MTNLDFGHYTFRAIALGLSALLVVSTSHSQELDKQVEIVFHSSPGDGGGILAETIAAILKEENIINVPVQVNYRQGGGGTMADNYVAERTGDPHVLRTAQPSTLTTPIRAGRPWDGFTPIAQIATEYKLYVARADAPWSNMIDVIEDAKARPNEIMLAAGLLGAHDTVIAQLLMEATGTEFNIVTFKDSSAAVASLLGGHTELFAGNVGVVSGLVASGDLKVLGVVGDKRLSIYPDARTLTEQGYNVELPQFRGLLGAPGLAPEYVKFWENAIKRVLETKQWDAYVEKYAVQTSFLGADEFGAVLKEQAEDYTSALTALGVIK